MAAKTYDEKLKKACNSEGHPRTDYMWEGRRILDEELLADIPETDQRAVLDWIAAELRPAKKVLQGRTSYGMKHILFNATGVYLTNNQFKDAMLISGYLPADPAEINWSYRLDKRSPAFDWRRVESMKRERELNTKKRRNRNNDT